MTDSSDPGDGWAPTPPGDGSTPVPPAEVVDDVASNRPSPVELLRNGEVRLHLDAGRVVLHRPKVRELRTLVEWHQRAIEETTDATDRIRDALAPLTEEERPLSDRERSASDLQKMIASLRAAEAAPDGTPTAAQRNPEVLARLEAAKAAGPLEAGERRRLREIRSEQAANLIEQDSAIIDAMLHWWVDAIRLLAGRTVDPEELDAGFGEVELPGRVIQHLRTTPLVRGG